MSIGRLKKTLLLATLAWLSAAGPLHADVFVRDDIITDPAPALFSVCHGFSCALVTEGMLTDNQWFEISAVFERAAATPEEERGQIAAAIARFETIVGKITGTSGNLPENRSKGDRSGQMDCIDESTNTTTYLRILVKAGLLRWHRVEDRVTRGWFLFGWPHTTAVMSDRTSGKKWAIDSWFFANGIPPVIVPLEQWRQVRWRPGKSTETAIKP